MSLGFDFISGCMLGIEYQDDEFDGPLLIIDLLFVRMVIASL